LLPYKSEANKDISLIRAKEWLTLLKPINEKFDTLHNNCALEQSQKEARAKNQAKFDHLCRAIEAMAFVKDEVLPPCR
jgi:hypothetical protein